MAEGLVLKLCLLLTKNDRPWLHIQIEMLNPKFGDQVAFNVFVGSSVVQHCLTPFSGLRY